MELGLEGEAKYRGSEVAAAAEEEHPKVTVVEE